MGKASWRFTKLQSEINEIENHSGLKKHEADILFMLMQFETFDYYSDASLSEIARYLQIGKQMTRQYLKNLEEHGAIERVRKRSPITFAPTGGFKRKYGIVPIK
jgi:DNA-binding MarR family transcriptional regulator